MLGEVVVLSGVSKFLSPVPDYSVLKKKNSSPLTIITGCLARFILELAAVLCVAVVALSWLVMFGNVFVCELMLARFQRGR